MGQALQQRCNAEQEGCALHEGGRHPVCRRFGVPGYQPLMEKPVFQAGRRPTVQCTRPGDWLLGSHVIVAEHQQGMLASADGIITSRQAAGRQAGRQWPTLRGSSWVVPKKEGMWCSAALCCLHLKMWPMESMTMHLRGGRPTGASRLGTRCSRASSSCPVSMPFSMYTLSRPTARPGHLPDQDIHYEGMNISRRPADACIRRAAAQDEPEHLGRPGPCASRLVLRVLLA